MQILSLDLGTVSGWCAGDTKRIGEMPEWGCFELAGSKHLDRSFIGLFNELSTLIDRFAPGYVVYESPLTQSGRDASRNTVDLLVGLAAVTRLTCAIYQDANGLQITVPCYEQTFGEARKLVLGRGAFPKPFRGSGKISPRTGKIVGDAKEEVRLWIEQYGWAAIDNPDARDAAVLFRYAQMISRTRAAA